MITNLKFTSQKFSNKYKSLTNIFLLINFFLLTKPILNQEQENTVNANPFNDEDCIKENMKNFDFLNPKSQLIKDPNQCLTKTSQCCYVEINYTYGWTEIKNNYCALLTGDMYERTQQLSGILSDQSRYYADFTYYNFPTLTYIGNNLDYVYYKDFTCQTPPLDKEYYSYAIDNCALKNDDGTCRIVNDQIYADQYTKLLYDNFTSTYCSNVAPNGDCIGYEESKNYNTSGLIPLFDYLVNNMNRFNNVTYNEIQDEEGKKEFESLKNFNQYSQNFYKKCEKIKPAKVRIICPETYVYAYRIVYDKLLILFAFVILFV